MQSLLFHIPFAVALASFVVIGVIGIWWQTLVSEVLRRAPEHMTLAGRVLARSSAGMFRTIHLAEQVDKALAKRMRLLMTALYISGFIFLGSGLLALLTGRVVFAEVRSTEEGKRTDAQAGEQQAIQYSGEGFRLMIPSSVSVKKTEAIDYILYGFTSEGKGILGAYVGNQPNFLFDERAIGPESVAQLNGLPCKRVQAQKKDGTLRTELLIRSPRDRGWPMYIHFWYGNLEPEAKAMAEAIIASIAPQAQGAQPSSFPDPGGPDFPPVRRRSEDIIADMERELEEMKKQQGMTEEVRRLEAELKMRKDIHREAEEIRRMAREEPEKWQRQIAREHEEAIKNLIALTEQDLEEMKRQGKTEEVKTCEAYLVQLKEEYRLLQEKNRESREQEGQ